MASMAARGWALRGRLNPAILAITPSPQDMVFGAVNRQRRRFLQFRGVAHRVMARRVPRFRFTKAGLGPRPASAPSPFDR